MFLQEQKTIYVLRITNRIQDFNTATNLVILLNTCTFYFGAKNLCFQNLSLCVF